MNDLSYISLIKRDYHHAHETFRHLLNQDNLDQYVLECRSTVEPFERVLASAIRDAYEHPTLIHHSRLFLQRILYQINRLKLFWYDDLDNYMNEDSAYLFSQRIKIENAWQNSELRHFDLAPLKNLDVEAALAERAARDLEPGPSEVGLFFRNTMSKTGYRRLLAITSLDGLVEASQLSRVIGGVANDQQAMLTKILIEEYGGGKLSRKHSTFFSTMLTELGMNAAPEVYFDLVPWEVLANINYSFTVSERKRNFLRYIGGLLYFEISVPAAFQHYKAAGERLGLNEKAIGYWDVHIKEDLRHGQWMLHDVALPLTKQYKDRGWEIIWGYDQQRFLSTRASRAIYESILESECEGGHPSLN